MAFLLIKKCKFPRFFCKMPAKTQFFEIILKFHPTKRENALENLNYVSFVNWAATVNPNFRVFVLSLARKKIEELNFCFSLLFANRADNLDYVPQNCGVSKNFKKLKNQPKFVILNPSKISVVSALICSSGNFCFQRCSELNHRCSEFFR